MCLAEDCECECNNNRAANLVKFMVEESNRIFKQMKEEGGKPASYISIPMEEKTED